MSLSTTGTASPVTLNAAATAYQTFVAAGAVNGSKYSYLILDGTAWEVGWGLYTSATPSMTRNVIQSSTGSILSLSASAQLMVAANSNDMDNLAKRFASIAALRLNAIPWTGSALVDGYYGVGTPGGGAFYVDLADASTADNGATVIVDAAGLRWKRSYSNGITLYDAGCKGDGATDDGAKINIALGLGLTVFVPPGTFMTSVTIRVPLGANLIGFGPASLIKAMANFGNIPVVTNNNAVPTSVFDTGTIQLVAIDGNEANNIPGTLASAMQNAIGISLLAVDNFRILSCTITNTKSDFVYVGAKTGDNTVFSTNVWVVGCKMKTSRRQGISVVSGADLHFNDNQIEAVSFQGIDIELNGTDCTGRRIHCSNNVIKSCGSVSTNSGYAVNGSGSVNCADVTIVGGSIISQTGSGICYRDVDGLIIDAVTIRSPTQMGVQRISGGTVGEFNIRVSNVVVTSPGAQGFIGGGSVAYSHTYVNCSVKGATFGFQCDSDAVGAVYIGCSADACTTFDFWLNAATYCTFSGCRATGVSGNVGFKISSGSFYNTITGLVSTNNGYGVDEVGTADKNVITGCTVRGNVNTQITKVGASTVAANNIIT